MARPFRPKRRPLHWWALSLALWYTLFGFFIAPRLLRAVLEWQLPKQLNRATTVAKLKTNPFTFSAAIDGLMIRDADGQPFVSWDEVGANLEIWPLLRGELEL